MKMICERNKRSRITNIRHIGFYASFFVHAKCGFVSKYMQFDKTLIAYPCSTFIYCFTVHFNSLNFMHQLRHFYMQ